MIKVLVPAGSLYSADDDVPIRLTTDHLRNSTGFFSHSQSFCAGLSGSGSRFFSRAKRFCAAPGGSLDISLISYREADGSGPAAL
jgi:hypothetical protein